MIPKFPMFLAITLSSNEFRPNVLACFTSFKHFAHLWTACLVNPTRKGIMTILIIPNTRIPKIASRYPSKLVSYATMEYETESQCGHFTFCDLSNQNYSLKSNILNLPFFEQNLLSLFFCLVKNKCSRANF